ncbi:MAG: hypothetical protein H6627_13440 [Calditrichae bacterium]|nr:hypothetical protein [Calditrichia bacterium]
MRKAKYIFLCLLVFYGFVIAGDLNEQVKKDVVKNISELLQQNYVFEDVGIACGDHISSLLNDGKYNSISDYKEFAEKLTTDLQSISKDKHMRVRPVPQRSEILQADDPSINRIQRLLDMRGQNNGFKKVEILDGNIGYVDMRGFVEYEFAHETGAAAMKFLENSDALVFDMRQNGGGDPAMVQFICSYLFDKKTHLNSLYYRPSNTTTEFWTLDNLPGKKMPSIPVFVLTSSYTFSGAEEFCYNLKTRERATLIGETTGGGANPGGMFPVNREIAIFIPTGRAINPVTGTNWEGTGVEPDIKTTSEDAFNIAMEKAQSAAKSYRESKLSNIKDLISHTDDILNEAAELLKNENREKARQLVFEALEGRLDSGMFGEADINLSGYSYLSNKQAGIAVLIFEFNTLKFPQSANVYDSFGDALKQTGRINDAVVSYKKAVELAKQNNDENLEIFKNNLKEAEKLL